MPATRAITSDSFPAYIDAQDTGIQFEFFFVDGVKDLPYVDTDFFMDMLNSFLGNESTGDTFSMKTDGHVVTITSYVITKPEKTITVRN